MENKIKLIIMVIIIVIIIIVVLIIIIASIVKKPKIAVLRFNIVKNIALYAQNIIIKILSNFLVKWKC